jgi:arylsulfate sulfotransferase
MTALAQFETSVPASPVRVLISGGIDSNLPPSAPTTMHELPLLGFYAGQTHQVTVVLRDQAGREIVTEPLTVNIPTAPPILPPIEVKTRQVDRMEPGFLLIEANGPNGLVAVMTDNNGRVVWYFNPGSGFLDFQRLPNGNFLYTSGNVIEVDVFGRLVNTWAPADLATPAADTIPVSGAENFHHEVEQLSNGNFLGLSSAQRAFSNYPTSELDPSAGSEAALAIGEALVEFSPSGQLVRRLNLMDLLDPMRLSYDSLATAFYRPIYGPTNRDWAHANAVFPNEDGTALVSLRHQDAVVKVDRNTGSLVWILGDPARWNLPWSAFLLQPVGALEWPFHQHACKVTPEGTVLMFDNGNHRAIPPAPSLGRNTYSRVVEYRVDEARREVEQVWSFGGPGPDKFYSTFLGDADWLPETGNIQVTDGGRIRAADGGDNDTLDGQRFARILEVTRTTPPEVLFELVIDGDAPRGWSVYRSERLPGLYPTP